MKLHPRQAKGFTIMELLIASALAAILMIGILFATTQLARQTQRLRKVSSPTQFNSMVELLHKDLKLATACRVTENQIHLQGFMLLDKKTQRPMQQPAQVIYRLVEVGNEHWLMRHQRAINNLTFDDMDANLVCKGITTMQLIAVLSPPPDDEGSDDTASTEPDKNQLESPIEITDKWQPLPPVVQWIITLPNIDDETNFDTPDQNTLTYTLVLQ